MSLSVVAVVLLAAFLHATWNAMVKIGADKETSTVLVAVGAAVLSALALPFLPPPHLASVPFMLASATVHVCYYILIAQAYRLGDMAQVYPIMRGAAPLLLTLFTFIVLHDHLALTGALGIVLISAGVMGVGLAGARRTDPRAVWAALMNALVIALYTLSDGMGVRRADSPVAYTAWVFLLGALPLMVLVAKRRPRIFRMLSARQWLLGAGGGAATLISYGLVLWAMTLAPIALVGALRETSILFATAIAGLVLREHLGWRRLGATALIAGGAMLARLG